MKNTANIGFIGGGNMARSLIGGIANNAFPANDIFVSDPNQDICHQLQAEFAINISQNNHQLLAQCDVVVLAVKPQIMQQICTDLKDAQRKQQSLFISIAAGISVHAIDQWLGNKPAIVRCMPNTPSLVGCGMTGLHANVNTTEQQQRLADNILSAVGENLWVNNETDIDIITAVSGSGPAYFFKIMESMIKSATKLGLTPQQSQLLVQQTALGAAKMVVEGNDSPAVLREKVTSPNGTTEQGLLQLEKNEIDSIFEEVISAARNRAISLSEELEHSL